MCKSPLEGVAMVRRWMMSGVFAVVAVIVAIGYYLHWRGGGRVIPVHVRLIWKATKPVIGNEQSMLRYFYMSEGTNSVVEISESYQVFDDNICVDFPPESTLVVLPEQLEAGRTYRVSSENQGVLFSMLHVILDPKKTATASVTVIKMGKRKVKLHIRACIPVVDSYGSAYERHIDSTEWFRYQTDDHTFKHGFLVTTDPSPW